MDEIEALSNDELLAQINAFDPYDVEFVRRFRALEAQLAKADALAMAVTQEREMVCQDFGMHTDDMNDLVLMGLARDSAEVEVKRLRGVLRTLARDAEFAQRHAYAGELHATMKFASDTRAKIKEAIESGEQSE